MSKNVGSDHTGQSRRDDAVISVVIATYNGEEYILEQLRSIAAQTRKADEVIIADDGSTDGTVSVVSEFLKTAPDGWRLTVNENNLGYAENFHRLIGASTGEIIFLCDQDDIWTERRAEIMTKQMLEHPEIELLNTDYRTFTSGDAPNRPEEPDESPPPQRYELDRKTFFLKHPGCVMCFRRTFYDEVEKYWPHGSAHDTFLWGMALLRGSCFYIPYISLLRRVHASQTSGKIGHDKNKRVRYLSDVVDNCTALESAAEAAGSPEKVRRLYRRMERAHRYRLELVRDRRFGRAVRLIPFLGYYHAKRSYLIELMLALKGDL